MDNLAMGAALKENEKLSLVNGMTYAELAARKSMWYRFWKRFFDITFSLLALVLLSVIFLVVSVLIAVEDGFPILFVQERNGLNGKVFRMLKFRSMCKGAPEMHKYLLKDNELDGPAFKMKDDPRITKTGRFIRKTSIDELPQLINIIKGDMSIVGPRPLPTYETEQCDAYQKQRLLVKPGLTCYWQCSGRNDIEFDEWMEMDLKYIEDAGLWTDFKIILKTFRAVISGGGRVLKSLRIGRRLWRITKRFMDIVVSGTALLVLLPVMAVVAVLIKAEDGGSIFYRQKRIGKNKKEFYIYKFRSMVINADKIHEQLKRERGEKDITFKVKDDPRITRVGRIIRRTCIDELPQLYNILKGDMSIVGPRPLPVYEYEDAEAAYGSLYDKRYEVPQGLTCIWQISDRDNVSFEGRMQMDCRYAEESGLLKDLGLIVKTFGAIIRGSGTY